MNAAAHYFRMERTPPRPISHNSDEPAVEDPATKRCEDAAHSKASQNISGAALWSAARPRAAFARRPTVLKRGLTGSPVFAALLLLGCLLTPLSCIAASDTPDAETHAPPDQRELWVPTQQLKQILAKHPKAVVLSREQYEKLLREATLDRKTAPEAPRRAVLASASYQAHLAGKTVQVTGAFKVNVLSGEWSQLPLNFEGVSIGALTVDGEAALVPGAAPAPVDKAQAQSKAPTPEPSGGSLLLRGRGERMVTIEFTIPVSAAEGLSQFQIKLPSAASSVFSLNLPPDQRVESPQAIAIKKTPEATAVTATLSPSDAALALKWRAMGGSDQSLQPVAAVEMGFAIDPEKVLAEYDFDLSAPLGRLPETYTIALPANAKITEVTGDELDKWDAPSGKLQIHFQPGERSTAKLHIALEIPSLAGGGNATLTLPIPKIEGMVRYQGSLTIHGDEGVVVKDIATDDSLQPAVFGGKPVPNFIGSYRFTTPPNSPRVIVEKVQARFSADLDSLVEFKQEAIFIERTLTLHPEKGETFNATLTIPAGEEVVAVRNADDSEPDWHLQDKKLGLRWTGNTTGDAGRVFKIRTRVEPPNWGKLDGTGLTFALEDVKIEGAERVTGYIALKADDAFRLEAEPSETLERRDGRTTPVKGDYAWFRGADFTLRVKVAKRPGEILASLTGYALPLESVLDLHAQIDYTFLHSGARSVRIRVPKDIAANFHFEGPQIAERNLAGDIWTIVFQKELTGAYPMKVTAQVQSGASPQSGSASDRGGTGILPVTPAQPTPTQPPADFVQTDPSIQPTSKESRFEVSVPVITPLDVVRTSGAWAIEANTETEITFASRGMNEVDSLLAPKLADYTPRHRVIGVFTWLGPDYSLALSGVRHAAASVLTSVVDRMNLDTVVSSSGTERNQATFDLRTAGAQYLDVELPEKSRLLSLSVNDELIKPVGDRPDQVRVELPGTSVSSGTLKVSILYETPKAPWKGGGGYAVHAPRLARSIPILRSQWRLFLPDGYEYTGIESNLNVPEITSERPLIAGVGTTWTWLKWHSFHNEPPDFSSDSGGLVPQMKLNPLNSTDRYGGSQWNEKTGMPPAPLHESDDEIRSRPKTDNQEQVSALHSVRISEKLNRIILPKLIFREASIREAIDFLKKKSVELDTDSEPDQRGVNIVLKLDYPEAAQSSPGVPGLGPVPATPAAPQASQPPPVASPNDVKISLELTNAPLIEALRQVTNLASLKLKIEPYAVYVVSLNTNVLVTREWTVHSDLVPRMPGGAADANNPLSPPAEGGAAVDSTKGGRSIAAQESAKNWLVSNGVQFNDGTSAVYLPSSGRLIVRNTPDQLDLLDKIMSPNQEAQDSRQKGDGHSQRDRIQRKLDRLIIPRVEFRETTVRQAIAFLTKVAREVDIDSAPGERGVNIELKAPGKANDREITVSLTNIPLIEALRYVTSLAGMKFFISKGGVSIVDQSESVPESGGGEEPDGLQRISGLLPMKLNLPIMGRLIVLDGLAAAELVEFRYEDWWSRARHLWLWCVAGGLAALFLAQGRPWWRTLWMILALTAYPLVISEGAAPVCNAVLAGWLLSIVIQRVAVRLVFATRRREVTA